jgi:DNA-binding beta-propeller fold protein YncE
MKILATAIVLSLACLPAAGEPLQLEAKIPLGSVAGRIDHMAIDLARHRLFVAELGNDSVGVVDLDARTVVRVIAGMKNPQGVAYLPSSDLLYVANARDGSVRFFRGADYADAGRIDLGDDADNIRVNAAADRVFVGYGGGALAVIDPAGNRRLADIPLAAHPEAFQLDGASGRIYVNLPDAGAIAAVDPAKNQTAKWPMRDSGNFPMALREDAQHVLVAFRRPARLGVFAMADGAAVAAPETCGDSDDVFYDAPRHRIYVSCGEGFIDVFDAEGYHRIGRIRTVAGARTSLFVPGIDRLLLAVRANGREPAAIWVYRPNP